MATERILITGANGQIGSVLTPELRTRYGTENVLATDIRAVKHTAPPFETLNILDAERMAQLIREHRITQIYHLAAVLSAKGEQNPLKTWEINMQGLFNVLECARNEGVQRVFFPSSIAVFGVHTPRETTSQFAFLDPQTVYGISKAAGEYWCNYYHQRYGLDVRSLRYPGIVGHQSLPGGGTTDYAVEIFHYAIKGLPYKCFLRQDTRLPMMYMSDAIRATIELMECPAERLSLRLGYNLAGMSFTPEELTAAIRRHLPDFEVHYEPDFRQAIAETWPQSIDDSLARKDWNWKPRYDLDSMTQDMIQHLQLKYHQGVFPQ